MEYFLGVLLTIGTYCAIIVLFLVALAKSISQKRWGLLALVIGAAVLATASFFVHGMLTDPYSNHSTVRLWAGICALALDCFYVFFCVRLTTEGTKRDIRVLIAIVPSVPLGLASVAFAANNIYSAFTRDNLVRAVTGWDYETYLAQLLFVQLLATFFLCVNAIMLLGFTKKAQVKPLSKDNNQKGYNIKKAVSCTEPKSLDK